MEMKKPNVDALALTSTASEYSIEIGAELRPAFSVQVQCRTPDNLRISYTSGQTADGGDYFTLKSGAIYFEDNLKYIGYIYIRPETNSTVAEVTWWL